MRVLLDNATCQGHGRCYALSPELFEADDEGYSVLKVAGDLPAELEEAARTAADNCPEYAITLEESAAD